MVAIGAAKGEVHVYHFHHSRTPRISTCKIESETGVVDLVILPDSQIAAGYSDGSIHIWRHSRIESHLLPLTAWNTHDQILSFRTLVHVPFQITHLICVSRLRTMFGILLPCCKTGKSRNGLVMENYYNRKNFQNECQGWKSFNHLLKRRHFLLLDQKNALYCGMFCTFQTNDS